MDKSVKSTFLIAWKAFSLGHLPYFLFINKTALKLKKKKKKRKKRKKQRKEKKKKLKKNYFLDFLFHFSLIQQHLLSIYVSLQGI